MHQVMPCLTPRKWSSNLCGQKNHMVILHNYRLGVFKAKESDSVVLSGPRICILKSCSMINYMTSCMRTKFK